MDLMGSFSHWLNDPDLKVSSAVVHGMLMGMFAARLTELPDMKEKFFEKWLERHRRHMGENVEQFMDHKIRRDNGRSTK